MTKRIVVIQGHPDARAHHLGHELAASYIKGAEIEGHEVRLIDVAKLDFGVLRRKEDWEENAPPETILVAQRSIAWADHMTIFYPLWLGSMPALLKAFFEQVFRPGFAVAMPEGSKMWKKLLTGKTARIVVTMGMPAFVYRWYFGAHSLKSLERNILGFCGIGPIQTTLIGMVGDLNAPDCVRWLAKMYALGRAGR